MVPQQCGGSKESRAKCASTVGCVSVDVTVERGRRGLGAKRVAGAHCWRARSRYCARVKCLGNVREVKALSICLLHQQKKVFDTVKALDCSNG